MSAVEMQSLLARLYVDEYFRKLFHHQPSFAFEGYGLTEEEKEAVVSIDAGRLKYFAEGLAKQRESRLSRHFPLLFALGRVASGNEVSRLFRRFHGLHPSVAEVDPQIEIQIFSAFARRHVAGIEDYPPYAPDIVRYDFARYESTHLPSRPRPESDHTQASSTRGEISPSSKLGITESIRVQTFDWNIVRIADSLKKGTLPREVQECSTTVVFRKKNNRSTELVATGPTAEILYALDGQTTVQAIVDRVEKTFGVPGLYQDVVGAIRQLQEKGIVKPV